MPFRAARPVRPRSTPLRYRWRRARPGSAMAPTVGEAEHCDRRFGATSNKPTPPQVSERRAPLAHRHNQGRSADGTSSASRLTDGNENRARDFAPSMNPLGWWRDQVEWLRSATPRAT
jgi:hypothetical protein